MALHSTRALIALAVIGIVTLVPSPAQAHPFGDPQTVSIAPDAKRPEVVHVKWRAGGPDDLTLLGVSLGLLPNDRIGLDGAVDYQYSDPGVIGKSPKLTTYLLERITVTDGSRPCTGQVQPVAALGLKGATIDYTCAGPVTAATVTVRMLTDLNPAYKTLATGPSGQRAVYEGTDDAHAWTLIGAPPAPETGRGHSALVQLAAVIGAVLLIAAACVLIARRLRRRAVTA
ncbi:hypothetical protein ACQPZX_34855 [Actinoplanes sp. CA-142083]|uniref:hypothetical protein n=1 Tax=Actinoplanes sp. CA-142083 TaxID=3239903 RepID=UPI003D8B25D1